MSGEGGRSDDEFLAQVRGVLDEQTLAPELAGRLAAARHRAVASVDFSVSRAPPSWIPVGALATTLLAVGFGFSFNNNIVPPLDRRATNRDSSGHGFVDGPGVRRVAGRRRYRCGLGRFGSGCWACWLDRQLARPIGAAELPQVPDIALLEYLGSLVETRNAKWVGPGGYARRWKIRRVDRAR